jgi:hypothetical protein
MSVFDNNEVKRLLDATFGVADYSVTVASPQLRLVTAVGTDSTAGTLVTGGSYSHQAMAMSAAVAASRNIQNSGTVSFTGMPAVTVPGVEIYDGAGTNRKAYGALASSKTTASGDTLSFAAGAVVVGYQAG